MLEELLTMNPDLHAISFTRRTPFLDLLEGLSSPFFPNRELPLGYIRIWLGDLQKGGVDLEAYGREEVQLHQRGLVSWEWEGNDWSNITIWVTVTWLLTSLTYGPSPSDWQICLEQKPEPSCDDLGDIPGGWIEEEAP